MAQMLPRAALRRLSTGASGQMAPRIRLRPVGRRWNHGGPQYQAPTPPQQAATATNPHRTFYSTFGVPVLKVVFGALFTYELLYWSWLKLESLEEAEKEDVEVKKLQQELEDIFTRNPVQEKR